MTSDFIWNDGFKLDIEYGFLGGKEEGTGRFNPQLILNQNGSTVEHALIRELSHSKSFTFSVAFISAAAIAQLKQHFLEFKGTGRIVTSTFLNFNEPRAFAELLKLKQLIGLDVRLHTSEGFHPKGYIFEQEHSFAAMIGSANLTSQALSENHEWNLKVAASKGSDLARQLTETIQDQVRNSIPLTQEWIDAYSASYMNPRPIDKQPFVSLAGDIQRKNIQPNDMQKDALLAIDFARTDGATRAIVISATGTGKTMLSALDVRAFNPARLLFIAHREQILDRTIREYHRVFPELEQEFGKLTGTTKEQDKRFVFSTIQTLSQESVLSEISKDTFDYVIIDEAHRAGAESYRRVIDHLVPKFLLGMTATPERTDGFNVFELFNYCVPYEIRLNEALEAKMLSPFHYYGISDITYADGSTITDVTNLNKLVSPNRIQFILEAIRVYGQAGNKPRGLIFCSRTEEARLLSEELNARTLNGQILRTVSLTGEDSIARREKCVEELETGLLDYIITVDVFNEGVDIPSVNQVIMLRQTQSPIVFVQQLGRGLRLSENKDYLVVIDFIGNYANNYMIPIALFGDDSLNRESIRERLNETVEGGTAPGLSSVNFDEISRERILESIISTKLDSMANLKNSIVSMSHRVGGSPKLWDFYRFKMVDPVLLATRKDHYPALLESLIRVESGLNSEASLALSLLSHEVLSAKRLHEFVLLELLIANRSIEFGEISRAFSDAKIHFSEVDIKSSIDTLALRGYTQAETKRYKNPLVEITGSRVSLSEDFAELLRTSPDLSVATEDLLSTGHALTRDRYSSMETFTPGMQYSRRDSARLVGWPRATASTIYGYKTDEALRVCTIFVTLHKAEDVVASSAYQDRLVDTSSMVWFSKNNRTLKSPDVRGIVAGSVTIHVFVKKDDAEGSDHYYLGTATPQGAHETTMRGEDGQSLPVVTMVLKFSKPIRQGLFDYFAQDNAD